MRILHINFSDLGGGAEEFALSLSKHQENATLLVYKKQTSHEHVVKVPRTSRSRLFEFLDKVLWKSGIRISFRSYFGFPDSLHGTYKMLRSCEAYQKADIIHLHNIHGEFFDLSAVAEIAKEKPVVWTSHDLWIATGGEGGFPIGTGDKSDNRYPFKKGIIDSRRRFLNRKKKILSQSGNIVVVAPSETHRRSIREVHPTLSVKTIYNGIDQRTFHPAVSDKLAATVPKIVILNSASPYKNSKTVIEALEKVQPKFHLHVIGEHLSCKIEKVTNHGFISYRHELAKLFRTIDIGVISSRAETFGLLPAELAACGVRVFLNESLPVFKEHVELYNARLFKDENDLITAVQSSLQNIERTREEGKRSARMVAAHLNRIDTVKNYDLLYREMLK